MNFPLDYTIFHSIDEYIDSNPFLFFKQYIKTLKKNHCYINNIEPKFNINLRNISVYYFGVFKKNVRMRKFSRQKHKFQCCFVTFMML